jgi:integrase/recombinase XerD
VFETKTGKERTVPIGDVGMSYLKLYLEKVRPLVCKGFTDENTVFVSIYEGKTLCHETINRFLGEACGKAEIKKKITCHCFRHSFGTHLLENGAGIKTVSMLLGHTDLMSTEKYTRLNPESLRLTLLKYHPREKQEVLH